MSARNALLIRNDGALAAPGPLRGLASLRQRVSDAGGVLDLHHRADTFMLHLHFDQETT